MNKRKRCPWPGTNLLMIEYHDKEWGVVLHDDQKLFEFLVLDAFQAGLSWEIVLNKRHNFTKAFGNYNLKKISKFSSRELKRLLADKGIIRNRMKILATIENARRFQEVQKEFGSFDKFIWQFVKGKAKKNKFKTLAQLPAETRESEQMSKALKMRGFKFVGPTICYAFMQATGMVNDHLVSCFRYNQV